MFPHRRAVIVTAAALAACSRRAPARRLEGRIDGGKMARGARVLSARAAPGQFGAGVMVVKDARSWFVDGDRPFPLAGLSVLPLALAALSQIDARSLTLNEPVAFTDLDLSAPPSAIDAHWPTPPDHHAAALPVADLIALAVQTGDDTAADVLMRRIGGPGAVGAWLQSKGIAGIRVDRYAREVAQNAAGMAPFEPAWKDAAAWLAARDSVAPELRQQAMDAYLADPRDTATPRALALLLDRLALGELVSARSTGWLLQLMGTTPGRFQALARGLPSGSALAHLSGQSVTDLGFTPAAGDVGIATLPGGMRLVLVTLASGSTATQAARDRLFADFVRLAVGALG